MSKKPFQFYRLYRNTQKLKGKSVPCFNVVNSIMKALKCIRRPNRCTDMCKHCEDYRRKALPRMESVVKKARAGILDVVPNYFRDVKDVAGQPGVRIEASSLTWLFDWLGVDHEDPQKAAVIHPCAVEVPFHLHDMEAACRKALGPFVRCAEAYEHHIVSAERLSRCKSILEKNLPRWGYPVVGGLEGRSQTSAFQG